MGPGGQALNTRSGSIRPDIDLPYLITDQAGLYMNTLLSVVLGVCSNDTNRF